MRHDFTDVESLWFEYEVRNPESVEPDIIRLDMDRIAIDLQSSMPTLLKPTGKKNKDGTLEVGFQKLIQSLEDGTERPVELPPFLDVIVSIRRILQIPVYCSDRVTMAVFTKVCEEWAEKAKLKKDTPALLDSPEPSPVRSQSKRSRKKR